MSFGSFQTEAAVLTEDEKDFIEYMHVFSHSVCNHLTETKDKEKAMYYRGMLYALKSVSQVYETLLKGDFQ